MLTVSRKCRQDIANEVLPEIGLYHDFFTLFKWINFAGSIDVPVINGSKSTVVKSKSADFREKCCKTVMNLPFKSAMVKYRFFYSPYRITAHADRMIIRLDGISVTHRGKADIISNAAVIGSIQTPAGGKSIILTADLQTTKK